MGGGLKEEDREACPYEGALKGRRKGNAPQSLKRGKSEGGPPPKPPGWEEGGPVPLNPPARPFGEGGIRTPIRGL